MERFLKSRIKALLEENYLFVFVRQGRFRKKNSTAKTANDLPMYCTLRIVGTSLCPTPRYLAHFSGQQYARRNLENPAENVSENPAS